MNTMRALMIATSVMLPAAVPTHAVAHHVTGHVEAHPWSDGLPVGHGFHNERHDSWSYWGHPLYGHHHSYSYVYYCPSAGAYYPYVTTCFYPWVAVPAW